MTRSHLLASAVPMLLFVASGGSGEPAAPRTTDLPIRGYFARFEPLATSRRSPAYSGRITSGWLFRNGR
jgi:hypothetical protein